MDNANYGNVRGIGSMPKSKGGSLRDLVSSFDDLPAIMSKMNASSNNDRIERSHDNHDVRMTPVRGQKVANQAMKVIQL